MSEKSSKFYKSKFKHYPYNWTQERVGKVKKKGKKKKEFWVYNNEYGPPKQ